MVQESYQRLSIGSDHIIMSRSQGAPVVSVGNGGGSSVLVGAGEVLVGAGGVLVGGGEVFVGAGGEVFVGGGGKVHVTVGGITGVYVLGGMWVNSGVKLGRTMGGRVHVGSAVRTG